ncbi:MAG: RES family NAD+ phosphorylase [Vicinamibacterales bacterium]
MPPVPPVSLVRRHDTHRLVPSRHLPRGDSVLVALADDDEHLRAIFELDAATNDRLLASHSRLPGIGPEELVFGVPPSVVNATFCHAHPLGSRFNGPDRGAWYAAFEVTTAQAEVGFHKTVQLAEVGRFEDSVTYDDYLADLRAPFRRPASCPWHEAVPVAIELRRLTGAGRAVDRRGLAGRCLSQRAARGRYVPWRVSGLRW